MSDYLEDELSRLDGLLGYEDNLCSCMNAGAIF